MSWAHAPDLRGLGGPKLHGMQEVKADAGPRC
jgi:hypothetical protein